MKKQIWIIIIVLLLSLACESVSPTPTMVEPASTVTATGVTPTETYIPFPTDTPTVTPTSPPTLTGTPTPSIIEITPLPVPHSPSDSWQGLPTGTYFVPNNNLNVRSCPATNCAIIGKVYAGSWVDVYMIYMYWGTDEKWLCRTPAVDPDKESLCPESFIYEYEGRLWGELWLP